VGLGIFVTAVPWSYIGLIWAYTLVWMFIEDGIKLAVYRYLDFTGTHHKRFLGEIKRSLFSHSTKR